jgi:peptide/nickel transport system substrate-binding protein
VKFWDGDPLTASDVAFSLNYLHSPGSEMLPSFSPNVKSVTATGPYTVVVALKQPDATWQYDPTSLGIFEKKFYEAHKATFGEPGTLIMGSGPWEIDSLDPTTGAQLSANPNWWGGKVDIQQITVKFFYNSTTEALAFRAGALDFDPLIVGPKSFAASSGANILNAPSCTGNSFAMNTQTSGWDDVHVRRAVAYALNRTDIMAGNGGYATPMYTMITGPELLTIASPAQVSALMASLDLYPYSLTRAKQEMAESAYPHGFEVDKLLNEGVDNTNRAVRFAAYSALLRMLSTDVPYVPLYLQDASAAISSKFTFPGFNQYSTQGAYALDIRPAG